MDTRHHLPGGSFTDYSTRMSSYSGLTLCVPPSESKTSGSSLHSPCAASHPEVTSPRYPSLTQSASSITSEELSYATAFSSLRAVHDSIIQVPSILVEDLTSQDTCTSSNSSRLWPISCAAPDLPHLAEASCSALGFSSGSSLKVPLGSWSDDNTLAATSQACIASSKASFWQHNLKRDSLEEPWLDLADDSHDDSLLQISGLADVVFPTAFCLSSLNFFGTIGRGGYGKVLLAEHAPDAGITSGHGSQVAVKVLAKKGMNMDDVQELKTEVRALREIAWGPVASPYGCGSEFQQKLQGVFQTREHVFIIMDRHCAPLSHPHFRRCLRLRDHSSAAFASSLRLSPLPVSFSLPIAFPPSPSLCTPYAEALHSLRFLSAELLLGLLFLHERGIIHQDIKPANILVSPGGHAVITDFGSSQRMPGLPEMSTTLVNHPHHLNDPDFMYTSQDDPRLCASAVCARYGPIVLGPDDQVSFTRRYAAPELLGVHAQAGLDAHGHGHVHGDGSSILVYDERVDFYSLGVMLRELAQGEAADGASAQRQDAWERASDGQPAREDGVRLDSDFEDFTGELSAHHPHDRLHGPATKDHPFFEPVAGAWDGVAALQFPPLPEVVWQEHDEDTGLDLRAYDGATDSQDSMASGTGTWRDEQLRDIPFDLSARMPTESLARHETDNSLELDGLRPPLRLPAALSVSCSMASTLQSGPHDPLPGARSGSLGSSYPPSPSTGQRLHVIRRRPGIYDLRKAYHSTSLTFFHAPHATYPHIYNTQARPTPTARPTAVRQKTRGMDLVPGAGAWSFEQQITIAMLATMGPPSPAATTHRAASASADARASRRENAGTGVLAFFRRLSLKSLSKRLA